MSSFTTDNVFWKVEHPSGASGNDYKTRYAISSAGESPSTASFRTANCRCNMDNL